MEGEARWRQSKMVGEVLWKEKHDEGKSGMEGEVQRREKRDIGSREKRNRVREHDGEKDRS